MSLRWRPARLRGDHLAGFRRSAGGALVGVLVAGLLSGCTGDASEDGDEATTPPVQLTPITKFDAGSVVLLRQEFCEAVPEAAVSAAIGGVEATDAYRNGQPARITRRVRDVAHEYNCTWTGERGDVARAWIFAPRVTVAQARQLAREAARQDGCREVDSHAFGAPSAGILCRVSGGRVASYRGLFVDSWLACSLTDRRRQLSVEDLLKRAGRWCVQVAKAAAAG